MHFGAGISTYLNVEDTLLKFKLLTFEENKVSLRFCNL